MESVSFSLKPAGPCDSCRQRWHVPCARRVGFRAGGQGPPFHALRPHTPSRQGSALANCRNARISRAGALCQCPWMRDGPQRLEPPTWVPFPRRRGEGLTGLRPRTRFPLKCLRWLLRGPHGRRGDPCKQTEQIARNRIRGLSGSVSADRCSQEHTSPCVGHPEDRFPPP